MKSSERLFWPLPRLDHVPVYRQFSNSGMAASKMAGAELAGNLWEYNMAKVVVIDVSEDYRLLQSPMPNGFYPVLSELWFPRYNLPETLASSPLVQGFLYDWHETGDTDSDSWYVGVVAAELAAAKG